MDVTTCDGCGMYTPYDKWSSKDLCPDCRRVNNKMTYREGEKVIYHDKVYMVWEVNNITKKYTLIRKGIESIEVSEKELHDQITKGV